MHALSTCAYIQLHVMQTIHKTDTFFSHSCKIAVSIHPPRITEKPGIQQNMLNALTKQAPKIFRYKNTGAEMKA